MKKDEISINIAGRIKPRLLFGATFEMTICKSDNGYYIKDFPDSLFENVKIDGVDFKEDVSKEECKECGSLNVEPFFHVLLEPLPYESHESFSESTKQFMSCLDCGHIR